jgi:hypothetical protein
MPPAVAVDLTIWIRNSVDISNLTEDLVAFGEFRARRFLIPMEASRERWKSFQLHNAITGVAMEAFAQSAVLHRLSPFRCVKNCPFELELLGAF